MVTRNKNGQFVKGSGIKDISGNRYGKLIAVRLDIQNSKSYWLCKCDCGKEKVIRADCLNRIQSCGCVKKEQDRLNLHHIYEHGMYYHPAYHIWSNMISRCTKENDQAYKDYGGRGISVCPEWMDVKVFCEWMDSKGYRKGLSIERIDVNGNYEPNNCTLIPLREQALNRRTSVIVMTDKGVIAVAKEAYKVGVPLKTVRWRLKHGEWQYDRLFNKGRNRSKKDG